MSVSASAFAAQKRVLEEAGVSSNQGEVKLSDETFNAVFEELQDWERQLQALQTPQEKGPASEFPEATP